MGTACKLAGGIAKRHVVALLMQRFTRSGLSGCGTLRHLAPWLVELDLRRINIPILRLDGCKLRPMLLPYLYFPLPSLCILIKVPRHENLRAYQYTVPFDPHLWG